MDFVLNYDSWLITVIHSFSRVIHELPPISHGFSLIIHGFWIFTDNSWISKKVREPGKMAKMRRDTKNGGNEEGNQKCQNWGK